MVFKNYTKPESVQDAFNLLQESDQNIIIGGGAWLKFKKGAFDTVIDLSLLKLDQITLVDGWIEIGAMSTLRQIETNDLLVKECNGIFSKAVKSIMGVGIRNIATIGGSIMGKYAFSDILTPLQVMETRLVFHNVGEMSLEEFLKIKKFPKDILLTLKIKQSKSKGYFKTVKKTALDFPVLNIAISNDKNIKISVGARPSVATRAYQSESKISEDISIEDIVSNIVNEIKLSANTRASKEYREELLAVYLKRGLQEVLG